MNEPPENANRGDGEVSPKGHRITHTGERVSTTIIAGVAEFEGVHPLDLPPLFTDVDADVVDRLYELQTSETFDLGDPIGIAIGPYDVGITSTGEVTIQRRAG